MRKLLTTLVLFSALAVPASAAETITIVAAEHFYGETAAAIGGDRVSVESVIVAAGTDPHDFEPPASVAVAVADADIVVMNGAGYDHWIEHLVEASANDARSVIDVASLVGVTEGANPHVWYDPAAMPALADALTAELVVRDPANRAGYESRRDAFLATLAPLAEEIAALRARFEGAPVAATEPVFGYMAEALGLSMQNETFQTAIMNETEPSARDVAALEDAIRAGEVRVLFYNAQVEDAFTHNLAALAKQSGVPLVAVTETQPEGTTFAEWMLDTVHATAKALGDPSS